MASAAPRMRPLSCWKSILRSLRRRQSTTRCLSTVSAFPRPSPPPPHLLARNPESFIYSKYPATPFLRQPTFTTERDFSAPPHPLTTRSPQADANLPSPPLNPQALPRTHQRPPRRPTRRPRPDRRPHPALRAHQPGCRPRRRRPPRAVQIALGVQRLRAQNPHLRRRHRRFFSQRDESQRQRIVCGRLSEYSAAGSGYGGFVEESFYAHGGRDVGQGLFAECGGD